MSSLDLNLLKVLNILLQVPNTKKAGEILHLSQSSVSKSLAKLRIHFDDPLFIRDSYGLTPTNKAIELGKTLPSALTQLELVINNKSSFSPELIESKLTIAMNSFIFPWLGTKLFHQIHTQAPKSEIQLLHWNSESDLALTSGKIDVGINYLLPNITKHIYQQRICQQDFVCVVRSGHPIAGNTVTPELFTQYGIASLIIPDWNVHEAKTIEIHRKIGCKVQASIRSTSLSTLLDIVVSSALILPVPRHLAQTLDKTHFETSELSDIFKQPNEIVVSLVDRVRHSDPLIHWLNYQIKEAIKNPIGLRPGYVIY